MTIAYSRVFSVKLGMEEETACIVPFADMINHKHPAATEWQYDEDLEGFTVVANVEFKKGQEVTLQYTENVSNIYLFLAYGFVQPHNYANEVLVELKLDANDPLYLQKRDAIHPEFHNQQFKILANLQKEQTVKFLSFARFIVMKSKDMKNNEISLEGYQQKLSRDNELQAWKFVK